MGFDCYGLNPSNPSNAVKPEAMDWSKKPSDKEKEKYFKEIDVFQEAVVGSYFRNNVWWWSPLWEYVCFSCSDILTGKDMAEGQYNSGHKISATKAKRIAKRLEKLLERLLDELIIEIPDESITPIPTKTFLEMEEIVGEKIYLIGLS